MTSRVAPGPLDSTVALLEPIVRDGIAHPIPNPHGLVLLATGRSPFKPSLLEIPIAQGHRPGSGAHLGMTAGPVSADRAEEPARSHHLKVNALHSEGASSRARGGAKPSGRFRPD